MTYLVRACFVLGLLAATAATSSAGTLYHWDDGAAEGAYGASELWWGNTFTAVDNDTIDSVDVMFGYTGYSGAVTPGTGFGIGLFSGNPLTGLSLLQWTTSTVGVVDGSTFQRVDLVDTPVSGDFFVALNMSAPGMWPASIDTTPTPGVAWWTTQTVDGLPGSMTPLSSLIGTNGSFMIRANGLGDDNSPGNPPSQDDPTIDTAAVPEPVSMAGLLLASGAVAGYLRRRRA